MRFEKRPIHPKAALLNLRLEGYANRVVRAWDRLKSSLALEGRKANYDDERYEFVGGPCETLRRRHYDRSLRLLWKAEAEAPQLSFRDCSDLERRLAQEATRMLTPEEQAARARFTTTEFKELLNREYSQREKQAIVNVLATIGHGEAYAWLVSAELLNSVKSTGARAALTMQVFEEAKHFVVLRELLMAFECPIPRLCAWEYLFLEGVYKAPGLEKFFGMNVVVEGIALGLFGMMSHLPGLELLRFFHLDESRHTGLPLNYFREFPLSAWKSRNPWARLRRLRIILPALALVPHLEADLAELGIDAFEFGGSTLRKISFLAERAGFHLPLSRNKMLGLINLGFNQYCQWTRPSHCFTQFMEAETTRARQASAVEFEIFGAPNPSAA